MQYYFKRFFVLHSTKVIFSFLIKKSRQKAIEIEIAFFFHSLGNPKGRTLDHVLYVSHIRHNFPLQTYTYMGELVEIFLKLSMKTVQVHLIIWTTLVLAKIEYTFDLDLGRYRRSKFQNSPFYLYVLADVSSAKFVYSCIYKLVTKIRCVESVHLKATKFSA